MNLVRNTGNVTMHLSGPCLQSENHLNYSHLVCLTLQGTILCCHPQFFFLWILSLWQLCEPLEWVIVEYGSWVCCWGNNEFYLIWFFSFRETHREDFPQTTTAPCQAQRWYAPMKQTNKQTNRSLQMIFVCEKNTWLHMLVWVSFFHIVWAFLFLCLCMCVCVCIRLGTDLSSSWQTPSTATAGPQPVDAERPKLQERSRGPKIFPWPLKALLIFTVSCF